MSQTRVNELDLLRFLAALMVVLYHYAFRGFAADGMSVMPYPSIAPVAKYGYLGVELFFMISGFVILMTAANGSLRGFVISRVTRLYPAFWAACTLTALATVLFGAPRFSVTLPQYLVNLTMLSGFVGVPSVDGAYWSLFVELKFYALVAGVLVVGQIHRAERFLVGWLVATAALEFVRIGPLRSLLIYEYAPYFIAGATFYLVRWHGLSAARVGLLLATLALSVRHSLAALPGLEAHYHTTYDRAVVTALVIGFFGVMLAVSTGRTGAIGRRTWVTAGALTYPLYLIHQQLGFLLFNAAYPAVNAHLLLWGAVLLVCGLAYVIHTQVERRFARPFKMLLERVVPRRS